ncbi:MAG: diacylglycerol kinase [Leptolyngbya sp.]|nr:MAG: diacylglycerol kinase [Leptolyngbya sp.]
MTSEFQTPDPDGSDVKVATQATKIDRELAWRIAPSLLISFKYAWAGISYAFHTQRNFRIHVILGGLAIGLGAFLHLSAIEISIVGLTIGAVLAMELLNTAIESVVDLTVKQNYHELARIAKDCAAAAVLIAALAAIGVASSLILPRLFIKLWQISQTSSFLH